MNYPFYGAASITASKRSQLINLDNSHGPAMYDISKQKLNTYSPKWTLKSKIQFTSCFKQNKSPPPQPGAYEVSQNIKHQVTLQNPNYRSQKHPKSTEKQSHVSDINIPSTLNTTKGSSFGYRDQMPLFKSTDYSPGPIYHPLKNVQQERSIKIKNSNKGFGFGQRNAIYKTIDTVPGPGAYFDAEKQNSLKLNHSSTFSTFGKAHRNAMKNTLPLGPGEYCPQISNNGSFLLSSGGFKLKGKLPQQLKYINPTGPGTYDLPQAKSNVGPRFNHSRNKSQVDESSSPFAYDCPRYPQNIDERKGYSLGKKIDTMPLNGSKIPGPGSYKIGDDLAITKKGGYMGRKTLKKNKVPLDQCFGKYDPNYSASARSGHQYKFSTQQKSCSKFQNDNSLGPGHYEVKQKVSTESYSMGTSQRFKELKKQRGFVNQQKLMMNSTIGYLPSYLKKKNEMAMSTSKLQDLKEKE